MIEVRGLAKTFFSRVRADVHALRDVSFEVGRNQIVGLLGANGAGKTTTIKCLCGLVKATAGEIDVAGHDVIAHPHSAAKTVAAVLEGNRNLYWRLNAVENIDFFAGIQGIRRRDVAAHRDELIERFGLTEKSRTPARMLSRGMQQKLALACALARRTPVLLLDEPTLGLDVEISHELRTYLRNLARTGDRSIVVTSHDMDVIEDVCDRVVVLAGGRVVADDSVASLIDAFRSQSYRVDVADDLAPSAAEALRARFPSVRTSRAGQTTTVAVEITGSDGIYDLVGILRTGRARITSITREEPDFEQVFLALVRQDATPRTVP